MNVLPDSIDLSAYLQRSDGFGATVRSGSSFRDDLRAQFAPRAHQEHRPCVFSISKLADDLEFRPGEVTAWAGYNGHRKSMFTGQVALDLMCQRQRVLVASFEMSPGATMARMARQAWGKLKPENVQLDGFAGWTDDRLWVFDHVGRISPDRCVAVCRYFAEEHRGQQVFIDSMMMVCASEEHLDEQKQFVTDIVRTAQETGLHIHVVAHCRKPASGGEDKPPTKYELRGSAAISDQCHNVVTVWANKAKKASPAPSQQDPDALVTVEKQRNGKWEGRASLWFDDASLKFSDNFTSFVEPYRQMEAL